MSPPRHGPAETPVILSFEGPDAVRYLNGQLTQDVSRLGDRSLPACVTDAKGKLQFIVEVCHGPDRGALWVVAAPATGPELRERLERYLIADEVEVGELSGKWLRIHAEDRPEDSEPAMIRQAAGPYGEGLDLWWPSDAAPALPETDPDELEALRIAAGIPRWGSELEAGMLPPEAGLDRTAIDYRKGCYIGQEVLSRIKTAGRVNRRLARLEVDGHPSAGAVLMLGDREVGRLTSVSPLAPPAGARPALGYLSKAGFETPEFELREADGRRIGTARRLDWA